MKKSRKEKSIKIIDIDVPMFGMIIQIYAGKDIYDFIEWIQTEHGTTLCLDESEMEVDGLTVDMAQLGVDGFVPIFLRNFKKRLAKDHIMAIGLLSHEALHATKMICESRGIPFNTENDEVIAYMQEHIIEEALKKLGFSWRKYVRRS